MHDGPWQLACGVIAMSNSCEPPRTLSDICHKHLVHVSNYHNVKILVLKAACVTMGPFRLLPFAYSEMKFVF